VAVTAVPKPSPPQLRSNTWVLRLTQKERDSIEARATKAGWQGATVWLRSRLLWAARNGLTAPETKAPEARKVSLNTRMTDDEMDELRRFERRHGVDLAQWARAIALSPDTRLTGVA
jgi:hypothetical protein